MAIPPNVLLVHAVRMQPCPGVCGLPRKQSTYKDATVFVTGKTITKMLSPLAGRKLVYDKDLVNEDGDAIGGTATGIPMCSAQCAAALAHMHGYTRFAETLNTVAGYPPPRKKPKKLAYVV